VIDNLLLALQITAIGMGLVFGSIILFWLLMAVMVRVTNAGHSREEGQPQGTAPTEEGHPRGSDPADALLKRRAVAAAVAVAVACQSGAPEPLAGPVLLVPLRGAPVAQASAWQVVQRARSLRIFPRGRAR